MPRSRTPKLSKGNGWVGRGAVRRDRPIVTSVRSARHSDARYPRQSVPCANLSGVGWTDPPQGSCLRCVGSRRIQRRRDSAPKPASRNQGKAYQNQVQALLKGLSEDRDFVLIAQNGPPYPGDAASVARAFCRNPSSALARRAVFPIGSRSSRNPTPRPSPLGLRPRDHRAGRLPRAPARGTGRCRSPRHRALGDRRRSRSRGRGGILLRRHCTQPRRRTRGYSGGAAPRGQRAEFLHSTCAAAAPTPRTAKCARPSSRAALGERRATDSFHFRPGPGLGIQVNELHLRNSNTN